MRIHRLWLDGYGRFAGRVLDLDPGFQVIVGPNEQGKTTLRAFIGDILFGQKRSALQRVYEPSQDVRRPWHHPDQYAGRLLYRLDDGREIEVQRNFDRRNESINVFDRTHGTEITGEFPVYRNRENAFAEQQLGVTKAVFLNTATIDHLRLDHLGDDDALVEIREKILSLADSSQESGSADAAIRRLEGRIAAIGRPAPNSKRPLPAARAQLAALHDEQARALARRRELADLEARRQAAATEVGALRSRHRALEGELRGVDRFDRAKRLREAERLTARIDELTQQCFALSAYREFPVDEAPEVQRAANAAATARAQIERTQTEYAECTAQLDEELERLGPAAIQEFTEIPEESERKLADLETRIARLRERLETLEHDREAAETQHAQAEATLAALPDFSHAGPDPVEWLTQLATSFRLQVQARDRERAELERLQEEVKQAEERLAEPERVFADVDDFSGRARQFEVDVRVFENRMSELKTRIEQLRVRAREDTESVPGWRFLALLSAVFGVAATATAYYFGNKTAYISSVLLGLAVLWFAGNWLLVRHSGARAHASLAEIEAEEAGLRESHRQQREAIETALERAGVESVRELEAMYDRYVLARKELESLRQRLTAQEPKCADETRQVAHLIQRLSDTFGRLGVVLAGETDVQSAANRAIARYQEYRDAKRRIAETRDLPARFQKDYDAAQAELEGLERQDIDLSLELRQIMRSSGFREESRHTSALSAVRAYRIRSAQYRQKRGRVEVLQERIQGMRQRLEVEQQDLSAQEEALARFLDAAGADSLDAWHEMAEHARSYRAAWNERAALQEQFENLMDGEKIDALRDAADADGFAQERPGRGRDEIKAELERVAEAIERKAAEEYALKIEITEKAAGTRPINEIEEECAEAELRVRKLELEMEAASY
ncbi:MAG: AAA family ATPase, partial [Candidatus Hydrogenedentes bacterium]|nr:AAA family ATPase [Candidatus Hydrogenedentota bacterium]